MTTSTSARTESASTATTPATTTPSTTSPSTTTRTTLRAEGFSCPSCVAKIEKQVGRLAGVESATVHFASARIEVVHDPARVSPDDLVAAVAKAGYTARPAAF